MKFATYQLPGDDLETARTVLFAGIFARVDSCDSAEQAIRRFFPAAEVILIGEIDREEFETIPGNTMMIP